MSNSTLVAGGFHDFLHCGIVPATDDVTRSAFRSFTGRENLEERWFEDSRVDRIVLNFMHQTIG